MPQLQQLQFGKFKECRRGCTGAAFVVTAEARGSRSLPLCSFDGMDSHRLKTACENGDHEAVLDICQKCPCAVTQTFPHVYFPYAGLLGWYGYNVACLHIASACDQVHCCRVLLDCGADVEAKDKGGLTPLMCAKTCEVMQLLLSRGANVRTRDKLGRTALHYCAIAGRDKRCVGELVSAGASVTAEDNDRQTPLMALIMCASGDVRQLDFGLELVRRGADVARQINGAERFSTSARVNCTIALAWKVSAHIS